MLKTINILNKRARFDYEIIEKFTAGIVLQELKSNPFDSEGKYYRKFCEFSNDELLPSIRTSRNTLLEINSITRHVANESYYSTNANKSLARSVQAKGLTIVP
jgi:SsrA-binding protein